MATCRLDTGADASTCLQPAPTEGVELARVGDGVITVEQIVERLRKQTWAKARKPLDKTTLRQFVEDQLRFELLSRAALERGLAADRDVIDAARQVMVRKLLQHDLGSAAPSNEISEERIAAYFAQHQDEYVQPAKRRLAHIELSPTEAGRALAESLLVRLGNRGNDGGLFSDLAGQHSLDAGSRGMGGELPYRTQDELLAELGPNFAKAAFTLGVGQLASEPVQSIRGWHVVKVLAQRDALTRSLAEVHDEIRDRLLRGQRTKDFDAYLAGIEKRHPVSLRESRLDDVLSRMADLAAAESQ